MNRKQVVGGVAVGLAGLALVAVVAVPVLVRQRLAGWVDAAAESAADVDVSIGDVQIALLSSFPLVTITVRDAVVTNRAPFAGVELARIPELELGIDLMSAISGSSVQIESVRARGAAVHVVYDALGRANWDVLPEGDGSTAEYHLRLSDLEVQGLDVIYEDGASLLSNEILGIDMRARADLTQSLVQVQTVGTIRSLTARYAGITWLQATKWKSDMKIDYDQTSGAIRFGENQLTVNALPLAFSGLIEPRGDDWFLDVDFKATDTSFESLLSLVPDAYGANFADIDAAGSVSFTGSVDGLYRGDSDDYPAFELDLGVSEGRFKFPDLPTAVEKVEAKIAIHHPEGPVDLAVIDAEHFTLTASGATVQGRVKVESPSSDPRVDASVDGRVKLGPLRKALPSSLGAPEVDGVLDLDFRVAGRMSDFEAQRLEAVSADGTIRGKDVRFTYEDRPVVVSHLDLGLSPKRTELNALNLTYAGSDIALTGGLDNLLPWFLADGVLGGSMALVSNRLDFTKFQSEEGAEADTGEPALVAVPANVDASMSLKIGTLKTKEVVMRDVTGTVAVRDSAIEMKGLKAQMYGGRVTLDGSYRAPTTESADLDMTIAADRLDVAETVGSLETLALIAPVLKRAVGEFNSGITLRTTLGSDGAPDLSILSSAGDFAPIGMQVQSAAFDALAGKLNNDRLKAMTLNGAKIAYAFDNGRVDLRPFTANLGPQPATVHGRFGPLDRSLDLSIDLPVNSAALAGSPLAASLGVALPKTADVEVKIGGTMEKPKIGIALKNAEAVLDAALDPLIAAATLAGDKLLAEARAAADALVAQAVMAAEKVVDEAGAKARKLRRDAKGKPLQEAAADAAAKLIEKEGDKAAREVKQQARKSGDALVAEAQKKRDKLIADATEKAKASVR